MTPSLTTFRAARIGDVNGICALHAEAFPGFFLSSLGPQFLRLLYKGFVREPLGVCIVAEDNGNIVGLAAGTSDPGPFFKRLKRHHGAAFAMAAIPGLLRNPGFVARKCLGALLYRGEHPQGLDDAALLSSLAVAPARGAQGLGQRLVASFLTEMRARGRAAVYLTTDQSDNERTNRFYARCGFELKDTFRRPGRRIMNRWVITMKEPRS